MVVRRSIRKVADTDFHDHIMIQLIKYFEASEIWETKGWDYKAVEAREALGAIAVLARKRRIEIQEQRKKIVRVKYKKKGESNE